MLQKAKTNAYFRNILSFITIMILTFLFLGKINNVSRASENNTEYSISINNMPLSKDDTQKAIDIFLNYLDEDSWHKNPEEAFPLIQISDDNTWWNQTIDNRTYYYFKINRTKDNLTVVVYLPSSVYSEDKFLYKEEDFLNLKDLIYKYLAPFRNITAEKIEVLSCLDIDNTFMLTKEETEIITNAYRFAWSDGYARYISGADYSPYSGECYIFRNTDNKEYIFVYYYDGYTNLYTYAGGTWLYLRNDDTKAIEKIINKYFSK